jgi:hypothetical protein
MAMTKWNPSPSEVLSWLHSQLGASLKVEVSLMEKFFGVSFTAELKRVHSIGPADAITLHFADLQTLDLDPAEMQGIAFLDGDDLRFEFWLDNGLLIEIAPDPAA